MHDRQLGVLEVNAMSGHESTIHRRAARSESGFTLIELLVTFAVLAVMLTLAAPSFVTFQRNSELTAAANSLAASMSAARAEALKRQLNVFIRPASSDDWRQGWTAYVDTNWNSTYDAGTDVQVVQQGAMPASITIASDGTPSDATSHYVMFSGAGFMRDNTTGAFGSSRSIQLSSSAGGSRFVIVNPAGRMRVCNPATESNCSAADSM
jgi:type IV fimbrial biogenesis protein FimT